MEVQQSLPSPAVTLQPVQEIKKKDEKPLKVQFYKGTYSSPFAMQVISKMGFLPLPETSNAPWSVQLFPTKNCPTKASDLKNLQEFQRHTRFPKSENVTMKSKLAKTFSKATKKGVTGLDFLPKTFVLPDQWKKFFKMAKEEKKEMTDKKKEKFAERVGGPWIIKPQDAAGGHGIMMVRRLADLGYLEMMQMVSKYKKIVVSQYISNPLLVDGLKFDMRLYVLVTSFTPLHIFLFSEGLARFCTEKYPADGNIDNPLAHLTNTSLNCHSDKFMYSNDINDTNTGHTRSLSAVLERLTIEGVNTGKILSDIHELVINTFSTVQPIVEEAVTGNVPFKRTCFQLFGLDIMLDDNFKPWLLEVNGNPALEPYTAMEVPIKTRLVRDMFRTVGLFGGEEKRHKHRESRRNGDFSLIFPRTIQPSHKSKRPKVVNANLEELTVPMREHENTTLSEPPAALPVVLVC